ncbi:MAG TPA: response regulator [Candidatus Acidoferrales bacterium]|nr:response regulator [Candidatus Acidoferrales bacterium]
MGTPLRLLIVEDSAGDAELMVRLLRKSGYEVQYERVDSRDSLQRSLQQPWEIVISDHSMPGFSGLAALQIVRDNRPELPFIFVSGTIGEDTAVEAMRIGAHDYIMKGNLARLVPAIERELREAKNRAEHKRTEQRMRQLEKFEAIGKLAGGIAHDFNNVIGAIMGWAELGSEEVPEGSRARKFFQQIRAQSDRAAGLTRQLLAYARRQTLEPRTVNLNQLISETTALLQKAIGEQIEMKFVLAPDLQTTRADPSQLEQVLMNLCFNARDAMPKGGQLLIETKNVDLDHTYTGRHEYAKPGKYVALTVADTGTGMPPAMLSHIFEPFFTTKEVGRGTGLGLATAYGIVKQHDGLIEVYSELGKGSVFQVYLPVKNGAPAPKPEMSDVAVRGGTETILVAEDHAGNLEMVDEILRNLGYRVILAKDGEEAIRKFREDQKDIALILLDVVMPRLGGAEAYEKIRMIRPNVPVIFSSGYSEESARLESFASCGAVLLQKPFAPGILARKVREALDKKIEVRAPR